MSLIFYSFNNECFVSSSENLGLKIERVVCENPKPRGTGIVDHLYMCFGVRDSEHAMHNFYLDD